MWDRNCWIESMKELARRILDQYALNPYGSHGLLHWVRVHESGIGIASSSGADRDVVAYFALLHDSRRLNESRDPQHGPRGAEFARLLHEEGLVDLNPTQLRDLITAIAHHNSHDRVEDMDGNSITIGTCWDADRLDLPRVGTTVNPGYLYTREAKRLANLWNHEDAYFITDDRKKLLKTWGVTLPEKNQPF